MSAVEQPKKMWGGDIINVPMIIKMNKIEILCATSEACDTDEGLVRYLSETGTFEYLDLELEQRWIADGGDPNDPPSTPMPPDVLGRLLEMTAELGVECVVRADIADEISSGAFETAYSARLLERAV